MDEYAAAMMRLHSTASSTVEMSGWRPSAAARKAAATCSDVSLYGGTVNEMYSFIGRLIVALRHVSDAAPSVPKSFM